MISGTKAEVLEQLAPRLQTAAVLPQIRFTVQQWNQNPGSILQKIADRGWNGSPLVVRSSAVSEDTHASSMAGHFDSVLNVRGSAALWQAIQQVVASLQQDCDQVFVQPHLADVALSGVAFSRDPNTGGPYFVINYDDRSGSTDTVTSGAVNDLQTCLYVPGGPVDPPEVLRPVVALIGELQEILQETCLDVEFAVDPHGQCYLFQVRPLVMTAPGELTDAEHRTVLSEISRKIRQLNRPHPYLFGKRTVYGVMPDWNPAEIIGIRPRPLAFSLYRELVTDAIWAYQRDNYGYRNLRSFPLMLDFHGLPYIDVRVSFNSFIPRDLRPEMAERLVNYYVDQLLERPSLHDKVEFHIVFSCYTFDLPQRLQRLKGAGFTDDECEEFADSLRQLTKTIINPETGLWRTDLEKIAKLQQRQATIGETDLDLVSQIYWLIEDCKRYGTLPFAGLARAGFIAVQLLQSLVAADVLSQSDYEDYMNSLDTVSSQLSVDFSRLNREEFLTRYGHLRPGTYDILSPRYDEAPDRYFDWSRRLPENAARRKHGSFRLSLPQIKQIETLIRKHRLDLDVLGLFDFIKAGIEGREYAKFVFSRSLSGAIQRVAQLGKEHGFSAEDCSFADITLFRELYVSSRPPAELLQRSISVGRERYAITRQLSLPPVISSEADVWSFYLPGCEPNFVTQGTFTGRVVDPKVDADLTGAVVMIPSADPGYDWIFSKGIGSLITKFGGLNSHMAIRAGELGIPAVIGAGETLYEQWRQAKVLEVNCANRKVQILDEFGGHHAEGAGSLSHWRAA